MIILKEKNHYNHVLKFNIILVDDKSNEAEQSINCINILIITPRLQLSAIFYYNI